ncbi:hypothetical protein [Rhodovulum sp. FJ3]|uniref:hypothetical protein n=1 Tax=Rhodovulum sp. FJ3 TaxID=3079053 RepID=UPI00293DE57D|nr:hypothetical protein [Rhodovulum sp. FJ3]MDV4169526.1 hypothetical protein [Rhodovulum sp. FJ3]
MTDTTKPEHKLRIGLFWPAFILAPLIWTAVAWGITYIGPEASLGVLGLPVAALLIAPAFGGIPYVLFGGPIMWYWAARAYPTLKHMSPAAVIAVVVSVPFALAFNVIKLMIFEAGFGNAVSGSVSFIVVYTGFGVPVAALWGATVSVIYQRLDRRFPVRAAD